MKEHNIFHKDFTLVVIGQIISLFGNAILRFALPLYLFNETGSATLLGVTIACSFIPMILFSPIGGIVADRVNKRNVMVILDFCTAGVILLFSLLLGNLNLVPLIIITLMVLYGIQGAYQPAVQASLPALIHPEHLVSANAVINQVSSLSGLIGPVIGGALYGFWGLTPILFVSGICFLLAAIMELFIHIPFTPVKSDSGILTIVRQDLTESISFIKNERPVIAKTMISIAAFNLFLSALIIVGIPVLIIDTLVLPSDLANQLYGITGGTLAAGGLFGGILTGCFANKLRIQRAYLLLLATALFLIPMGAVLMIQVPAMFSYLVITACCFGIMALASMFTIQMMTLVQKETPIHLIGKVISCILAVSLCAQPLGNALYGVLFDLLNEQLYLIFFAASGICCMITVFVKRTLMVLDSASHQ